MCVFSDASKWTFCTYFLEHSMAMSRRCQFVAHLELYQINPNGEHIIWMTTIESFKCQNDSTTTICTIIKVPAHTVRHSNLHFTISAAFMRIFFFKLYDIHTIRKKPQAVVVFRSDWNVLILDCIQLCHYSQNGFICFVCDEMCSRFTRDVPTGVLSIVIGRKPSCRFSLKRCHTHITFLPNWYVQFNRIESFDFRYIHRMHPTNFF